MKPRRATRLSPPGNVELRSDACRRARAGMGGAGPAPVPAAPAGRDRRWQDKCPSTENSPAKGGGGMADKVVALNREEMFLVADVLAENLEGDMAGVSEQDGARAWR